MANRTGYKLSALISILGLVTLLAGLVVMVTLPAIRLAAWGILALGVALLVIAFILDFRTVAGAVTGRRGKFSTGTTVMASIFVGITLLVNAISIGTYHRFDTTGLSQFTLTAQTKDVLGKMDTSVQVTAFFVPNDPLGANGYIQHLLKEYQNYTAKLTVREIDPDAHPDLAKQYGVSQYPSVAFESDKGRRLVLPEEIVQTQTDQNGQQQLSGIEAEHAFTSAILEVTGVVQKKLYFLSGHGEASIDQDYAAATQELRSNLFKVETIDLLLTGVVPQDASALIIAGPQKPLSADEVTIISNYMDNGGWVMFLLNPNPSPDMKQLLGPWGLGLTTGTVVDPTSSLQGSVGSPIVPRLRNFFGLTSIYFPEATALFPNPIFRPNPIPGSGDTPIQVVWTSENSSIQLLSLARTSSDSWLEQKFDAGTAPVFDESTEIKGPLELGFLVVISPPVDANGEPTGTALPTRLVVLGDSDFASNQQFFNGNNGEFFLNLVEVLTSGKELISLQRKVLPFRRLVVSQEVFTFIEFSSIGLVPILVLLAGGVIWWRRR